MRYYSTNNPSHTVTLEEAVLKGMASDGGLFLPQHIVKLPEVFIKNMVNMSLEAIGYAVANVALQGDVDANVLRDIVGHTLDFPMPLHRIDDRRYVMELFHGPTMAFKDVGARFMARLLAYLKTRHRRWRTVNVLVPTSGDTGGAVANGFVDVPGVHVYILYPQGELSPFQVAQFASLHRDNITAIEIKGTFDDCKRLVEEAFLDQSLNERMVLTSATSINVARLLPQTFYYFWAYVQLMQEQMKRGHDTVDASQMVVAVPCANLGNLASGLLARSMGLPIKRFVSVENDNNIFYNYMRSGVYEPRASVTSVAPALDAGDPTNFARVKTLLEQDPMHNDIVHAYSYGDDEIMRTIGRMYDEHGYLLDPHSAIAWRALEDDLQPGETGVALATAHPTKFLHCVEAATGQEIVDFPPQIVKFLRGTSQVTTLNNGYTCFKNFLLQFEDN